MAMKFTKDNFKTEVLESNIPVMVDFWAEWCGPCRMVGPIIEELASELSGVAKIGKVNVDEENDLAREYNVMTIPTIMVFKEGSMVERIVGFRDKDELKKLLDI